MNPFSKVKPFLSRRAPTFDKLLIRCKLIGLVNRYSPLLGISPRKKRALSHSSTFSISTPTSFTTIASVSSVQLTARAHLFTFSFATMGAIYHCYWNVPRAKNFQPFWRFAEMKPSVRRGDERLLHRWMFQMVRGATYDWRLLALEGKSRLYLPVFAPRKGRIWRSILRFECSKNCKHLARLCRELKSKESLEQKCPFHFLKVWSTKPCFYFQS